MQACGFHQCHGSNSDNATPPTAHRLTNVDPASIAKLRQQVTKDPKPTELPMSHNSDCSTLLVCGLHRSWDWADDLAAVYIAVYLTGDQRSNGKAVHQGQLQWWESRERHRGQRIWSHGWPILYGRPLPPWPCCYSWHALEYLGHRSLCLALQHDNPEANDRTVPSICATGTRSPWRGTMPFYAVSIFRTDLNGSEMWVAWL